MDDRHDRVRSMLLGVAVGDALGWPFERPQRVAGRPEQEGAFFRWRRRAGSRFWSYEESLPSGTYSDDTQLSLATARALLHEDWFEHLVSRELPTWRLYERGAGRTVLQSAGAWTKGKAPWLQNAENRKTYFASGANGAAMRVAGHAAVGGELLPRVLADAIATHGHPRALLGASMQAWTLQAAMQDQLGHSASDALTAALDHAEEWSDPQLLDALPDAWHHAAGGDYEQRWSEDRARAQSLLEMAQRHAAEGAAVAEAEVLDELGATDPDTAGAGDVCAIAALYLASRYASQPAHALRTAARQPGADTDTLASMVGALLGAWIGRRATETFPGVQDAETISALAGRLLVCEPPRTRIVDRLDPKPSGSIEALMQRLTEAPDRVELPDGRSAQLLQVRSLSAAGARNQVVGYYVRCDDGQGLLIVDRRKSGGHPRQDHVSREGVAGRSRPEPRASDVGVTPPTVTVRVPDPELAIQLLTCAGLTGTATDAGWRLAEGSTLIAGMDRAVSQLPLDTDLSVVEVQHSVDDLAAARTRLEQQGWQPVTTDAGFVVSAGGVAVCLSQASPPKEQAGSD